MTGAGNGNARKKVADASTPPWMAWQGSSAGKVIEFIERYCIVPKGHGAGQPMRLAQFQRDGIEALFAEGVRTGEFSMARGNGKSSLIAAVALAHVCLEQYSPQVPLIATKLRQIEEATYNVALAMAKRSPDIAGRILVYQAIGNKTIKTPWNDGVMFPISSDVDGLQGLDPSLALVDEVGFVSVESWDALTLAGGKRPESLVLGLGTTGHRESALYHLRQLHQQGVPLPGHVRINYSAPDGCDHRDRSMWALANPALAEGFLAADILEKSYAATSEAAFRRYRLNQWVELAEQSWLGDQAEQLWGRLADRDYEWDASRPAFAGVDVAMKSDSSAVIVVQERADGRWHAKSHIFWPDGGITPFDNIRATIRSIPNLACVGYDSRFFAESAQMLSEEGVLMIDVPQTHQRMVPAIGKLYRMIVDGTLTHDGAPDYATQVTSAIARESDSGIVLHKNKAGKKVDAAVATAIALAMTGTETPAEVDQNIYRVR